MIPLLIKYVLDDILEMMHMAKADKMEQLIMHHVVMIVVFVILRPPIEYFRQYYAQWTSSKILYDIRDNYMVTFKDLALNFTPIRKRVKSFHGSLMTLNKQKHLSLLD